MNNIILFFSLMGTIIGGSITEKTDSMKKMEGYFDIYWDGLNGKIWLEINQFDVELLYVNSLTAVMGSNDIGLDRNQLGQDRIVYFHRVGPKVLLIQPNYRYRANTNEPKEKVSVVGSSLISKFLSRFQSNSHIALFIN